MSIVINKQENLSGDRAAGAATTSVFAEKSCFWRQRRRNLPFKPFVLILVGSLLSSCGDTQPSQVTLRYSDAGGTQQVTVTAKPCSEGICPYTVDHGDGKVSSGTVDRCAQLSSPGSMARRPNCTAPVPSHLSFRSVRRQMARILDVRDQATLLLEFKSPPQQIYVDMLNVCLNSWSSVRSYSVSMEWFVPDASALLTMRRGAPFVPGKRRDDCAKLAWMIRSVSPYRVSAMPLADEPSSRATSSATLQGAEDPIVAYDVLLTESSRQEALQEKPTGPVNHFSGRRFPESVELELPKTVCAAGRLTGTQADIDRVLRNSAGIVAASPSLRSVRDGKLILDEEDDDGFETHSLKDRKSAARNREITEKLGEFLSPVPWQGPPSHYGENVQGDILESGFNPVHISLDGRIDFVDPSRPLKASDHGAKTSTLVFGSDTPFRWALGQLPAGTAILSGHSELDWQTRFSHNIELNERFPSLAFQSSSFAWGIKQKRELAYALPSTLLDCIARQFDFVVLQSKERRAPEDIAANVISVGGVRHRQSNDWRDHRRALITACDACPKSRETPPHWLAQQRASPQYRPLLKPDLVHFADSMTTGSCSGLGQADLDCEISPQRTSQIPNRPSDEQCRSRCDRSKYGGPSGATALVAGQVGRVVELWRRGLFHKTKNRCCDQSSERPSATLIKALLVNSARSYPVPCRANSETCRAYGSIPRQCQGWGVASVNQLIASGENMMTVNHSKLMTEGEVQIYRVRRQDSLPLRVTMAYHDVPGIPSRFHQRIDFDLCVSHEVSDAYAESDPDAVAPTFCRGNAGLMAGRESSCDELKKPNAYDRTNNIENVFLPARPAGSGHGQQAPFDWLVAVKAQRVSMDGDFATHAWDAKYSLAISGVSSATQISAEMARKNVDFCFGGN